MNSDLLHSKLTRINAVFRTDKLLSVRIDKKYIARYYKGNRLAYSLFHSPQGFVHMGISRDGLYKKADLLEQAKIVEKYITITHAKCVLELATGKGATSAYLASRYPSINFYGIDLPNGQLNVAIQKATRLTNFYPQEGDFHDLHTFKRDSVDVVFIVEALCHSTKKEVVLRQVYDVLRGGGQFIIVDAYAKKPDNKLTDDEIIAKKLTERGMAVENFELYKDVIKKAQQQGFSVEFEEEVSQFVLPTLYRFEKLAGNFLRFPYFANLGTKILPEAFTYNAISGYLMPEMIKRGVGCYYITVLRKP